HRRRARLDQVSLRPVVAHMLAELPLAQELDELRREEDANEQGGGAADENASHQDAARSSATRSSATPREPFTSTVSPGRRCARSVATAPTASSAWRCSPPRKVSAAKAARGPTVTSS